MFKEVEGGFVLVRSGLIGGIGGSGLIGELELVVEESGGVVLESGRGVEGVEEEVSGLEDEEEVLME